MFFSSQYAACVCIVIGPGNRSVSFVHASGGLPKWAFGGTKGSHGDPPNDVFKKVPNFRYIPGGPKWSLGWSLGVAGTTKKDGNRVYICQNLCMTGCFPFPF